MGDVLAIAVLAGIYWLVIHLLREQSADMATLQRERRRRNALARIGDEVRQ